MAAASEAATISIRSGSSTSPPRWRLEAMKFALRPRTRGRRERGARGQSGGIDRFHPNFHRRRQKSGKYGKFVERRDVARQPLECGTGAGRLRRSALEFEGRSPRRAALSRIRSDGEAVGRYGRRARFLLWRADALETLREQGLALVLVSSDMEETLALCDRILVFGHGRIVREFGRNAATQESLLAAAAGEE